MERKRFIDPRSVPQAATRKPATATHEVPQYGAASVVSRIVSIVLLDDHQGFREGLAAILESRPELHVVGQCSDGLAAVQMITSLAPDFAILDLNHPKLHGVEVIRRVLESGCKTKLVVLTVVRDEKMVREAFRAGASGYVLKDGPSRHLFEAIQRIQDGGVYVSPVFRSDLLSPQRTDDDPLAVLSEREREVFYLLVEGYRQKEIAGLLDLSPKTVDTHRAHLMKKLGITDLAGLVKFACWNRPNFNPTRGV